MQNKEASIKRTDFVQNAEQKRKSKPITVNATACCPACVCVLQNMYSNANSPGPSNQTVGTEV